MAEWLRRLTGKPKVSTAVGSNPALDSLVAVRNSSPGRPEPCEGNLVAVAGSCGGLMVKHPWPLLENKSLRLSQASHVKYKYQEVTRFLVLLLCKYRMSQKIVYAFGGMWNRKFEANIQNWNVNLSVKGNLAKRIVFDKYTHTHNLDSEIRKCWWRTCLGTSIPWCTCYWN